MIKLNASADFGHTGQYVARITGRNSKYTFEREFLGKKSGKRNEYSEAMVDDPGLYEERDVTRKGKKERYYIVINDLAGELCGFSAKTEDAMKIAKALDSGKKIDEIVRACMVDNKETYEIITVKQAEKAGPSFTVDEATEICWTAIHSILSEFKPEDAKKVLDAIQAKLTRL